MARKPIMVAKVGQLRDDAIFALNNTQRLEGG